MTKIVRRRTAGIVAALAVTTLVAAGCSDDNNDDASNASGTSTEQSADASGAESGSESGAMGGEDVPLEAADGSKVTLTGAIAAKYQSATEKQKTDLGKPLTGDDAKGTGENGVSFQQFDGGVITSKGDQAYVTWGKIRDAWNVKRDDKGEPAEDGKGGSAGPLGAPTSDETEEGDMKKSTFENGEITYNTKTQKVEVTVDGKTVAAE
ncbi:LGFP repeat-containing protein [Gordonia sp. (in: high G+C Gram-positive bacteria)]|uniref:LGFP repeat-containing protein n=1 Tax=Gordonia sp. (in: high G+C Gram-positive bacteria) TaxID=84139 RepID=UPI003F9E0F35